MTVIESIAEWCATASSFSSTAIERAESAFSDTIGCIIAEGKACEVYSLLQAIRDAASCSDTESIAGVGPESTTSDGAFTAATLIPLVKNGCTSDSGSGTASIAPEGMVPISRPRAATSATASPIEKTPAIVAATNSPMLWPIIALG